MVVPYFPAFKYIIAAQKLFLSVVERVRVRPDALNLLYAGTARGSLHGGTL
jgi:hypothetical protein